MVLSTTMVEPVDPFGDGDLNIVDRLPRAASGFRISSPLNSELYASASASSYESSLLPTDATTSASASRSVVAHRSILGWDAAVAAMLKTGDVLIGPPTGPEPHLKRIQRQIGVQAGRHLPAHGQP